MNLEEEFGYSIDRTDPKQVDDLARKYLHELSLSEKVQFMQGNIKILQGLLPIAIRYNSKPYPFGGIKRLKIPPNKFVDGPRGIVVGSSTCFPVSMARGATFDIELEERIGNAIGVEGRAYGANFFGGVCINLLRHPSWGRAQETYGEDPYHLGEMGAALTRGIQAQGMIACPKHFAMNSMENKRFKVDVSVDERTLREIYLPHFKKCIDEGAGAIMSAYNKVNGEYCGENKHLLTDILKQDWNFQGFIITDFMLGVRDGLKGIKSGLDVEMPFSWRMKSKNIQKWVETGEIPEERIDESVLRVLKTNLKLFKKFDPELYNRSKIACQEHIQLAKEAALKSMVLLQNKDRILPLNAKKTSKIAVLGSLADRKNIGDLGSSRVYPPYIITPLMGIQQKFGYSSVLYESGTNIERAKSYAKEAEIVIIVVGFTEKDEGEYTGGKGGDRDLLTLKPKDEELIKLISEINKNVIVVMEGSSAIIVEEWKEKVAGIIMAWYPGMEGGNALAHLLFGEVNFSGKLPFIVPKSTDQLPFFDKKTESIKYDYYHGYRLADKKGWEPAYPFGFGLSYTTFSYGNFRVFTPKIQKDGQLKISVDVSNNGKIPGDEIIQLYVGYPESKVDRVVRELKDFARIHLESNETKTVTLSVPAKDTAYYEMESNSWVIENGKYEVFVGSCNDVRSLMKMNFEIE